MKKQIFLTFVLLLSCISVLAQEKQVRGVVTSQIDNEPLIGVVIIVAGTQNGTVTDIDGKFVVNNSTMWHELRKVQKQKLLLTLMRCKLEWEYLLDV